MHVLARRHPHRAASGDHDRVQTWREWLDEAWSSKQGAVYKWLQGNTFALQDTFLVRPDSTPTENIREMDSLLLGNP